MKGENKNKKSPPQEQNIGFSNKVTVPKLNKNNSRTKANQKAPKR